MAAVKEANRARIEKEKEAELAAVAAEEGGTAALELAQQEAFLAYQTEAARLEALDTVTDEEKAYLEELQMTYEATREVKENILLAEVAGTLAQAQERAGLDGLEEVIDEAAAKLMALAKKFQEFPGDEETSLGLISAESDMHLIQEELENMA